MKRRSTVLAYHAVGRCPREEDPHDLWVATETFERQMSFLKVRRRVVSLAELVAAPDEPVIAVTFDDAYGSVLRNAMPILASYELPATVFVPTAHVGDRNRWDQPTGCSLDIMTREELVTGRSLGLTLESHGHWHVDLSAASELDARADLLPSLSALVAITGERPRFLAYPFREGSRHAQAAAQALGFEAAFTIDRPHRGRYAWERVSITPWETARSFSLKTSGWYPAARTELAGVWTVTRPLRGASRRVSANFRRPR